MELETLTEQPIPDAGPEIALDDPVLYLNRELSWLAFNQRVLAEAFDDRNLLLERVKFLAITASNLDEFYAKRVGWLKRLADTDPRMRTVDGLTVGEQLSVVLEACFQLRREMDRCWESVLKPQLAEHGVTFLRYDELSRDEQQRMSDYFEEAIFPVLTPLVVDPSHPFPFISSGSLSLILSVRHPVTGTERFARIKVPENRPRFVEAGPLRFVLLEDVIGAHLHMLFPGMEIVDRDCMRVIRNVEMGTP
ncbi:MAG: polyphosphate kinase 1, partial [Dehalococcoidia bacterium]